MKKALSIILSLMMVLTMLPFTAFAAEIESIEYERREPVTVYFETNGDWRNDNDGETQFFYYFGAVGYGSDDKLTVHYDDGSSKSYTGTYDDDGFKLVNDEDDSDVIRSNEFSLRDEQQQVHWTLGSDNCYYFVYNTFTAEVPVTVVENPYSSISFTPANKYTVIENSEGEWRTDNNTGDDYFSYYSPDFRDGDVLELHLKSGETETYTYSSDGWEFYDGEGSPLPDRNELSRMSGADNNAWTVGGENNYYYVEYKGMKSDPIYVNVIENPYKGISFEKANPVEYVEGSDMYHDNYDNRDYYNDPEFELGDTLTLIEKDGNQIVYTFYYDEENESRWEGRFVSEGREDIERNDVSIITNQRETPWVVGENNCTVEYAGFPADFKVTITENPVASIAFSKASDVVYYEGANMYYDNWDDASYYDTPWFENGDTLTVYDKNNNPTDYTYSYSEEADRFVFVSDDGAIIFSEEVNIFSNQREQPWTLGDINKCYVEYMGRQAYFTVSIIKNPVESISFTPVTPAVFTDGEQRYDEWDECYYYDMPQIRPGDVLTVEYNDERSSVDYTAVYDGESDQTYFKADDGDVIEFENSRDFERYSNQREHPWTVGGEYNYYTIEYKGKTCNVPVTIKANTVKEIKLTFAEPLTVFASDIVNGPDYNGAVYPHYEIPDMPDGTVLTITDTDDNDTDYTLRFCEDDGERYFTSEAGDKIHFYAIGVSHNQATQAWTVGGENYFTATYLGKSCQVPVTLVDTDVEWITFEKAEPIVFTEYEGGEWKYNDLGQRFYFYNAQLGGVGDVLTIKYKDGTEISYTVDFDPIAEAAHLKAADGSELDINEVQLDDGQWTNPWMGGSANNFTVKYHGVSCQVGVTVNHVFVPTVTAPTCTNGGYTTYTCEKCDQYYVGDETNALGHKWDKGVTKSKSATQYTITYTCTRCKTAKKTVTYNKKANTMTAKGKKPSVKLANLKKKNQTIAQKNAFAVSKPQGAVTYTKAKGNAKITVDSKTGKITVKKGLKKGTYKVSVKVKAAGTATVKAKTVTVTVTVIVK